MVPKPFRGKSKKKTSKDNHTNKTIFNLQKKKHNGVWTFQQQFLILENNVAILKGF